LRFWHTIKKFKNSQHFRDNIIGISNKQIDSYVFRLAPAGVTPKLSKHKDCGAPNYFNYNLNLEELKEIIRSVKSDSSPGPDLINYNVIRLIPDEGLTKLLEIFVFVLERGYFPNVWDK